MVKLYKREGSTRWYAYLHDPRAPDGLVRKSTETSNRAEARKIAGELQKQIEDEIAAQPPEEPILGIRWLDAVEHYLSAAPLKASTRYGYSSLASIIARSCLGDFVLEALTEEKLRAFIRERRASSVKAHNSQEATARKVMDPTVRRALSFMSSVYQWYIDREEAEAPSHNPLRTFDRAHLKESRLIDRHLRPTQFEDVLKACKDEEHKRIIITLLGTGMRTSELLSLRWGEVDFTSGFIEFGNLDPDRSKTHRARRIPILAPVLQALTAQKTAHFGAEKPLSEAYVFPSPIAGGERYSLSYLRKVLKRRTGLKAFRINDLRHTFASWLLQEGADPLAISRAMGHSTLTTTKRYAQHVSESAAAQLRRVTLPVPAQYTAQDIGSEET